MMTKDELVIKLDTAAKKSNVTGYAMMQGITLTGLKQ